MDRAKAIRAALDDKLAADIRVWDVRGCSSVTDYYVVATGTSGPHLRALLAGLRQQMKAKGVMSHRASGEPDSGWVVLDFIDVVAHIFAPPERAYYDIERLWEEHGKLVEEA